MLPRLDATRRSVGRSASRTSALSAASPAPRDRSAIPIRRVDFGMVEGAGAVVSSLANWGYFEGAGLALGLQTSTEEGLRLEGSAVMIAPGLALTASHVFLDEYQDLTNQKRAMGLWGIRSDGRSDAWRVEHMVHADNDDMGLLSVALMSQIHPDWYVSTLSLTTRTPTEGETVTLMGFREEKEYRLVEMTDVVAQTNVGDMYIAQGEVGTVYDDGQDSLVIPFPTSRSSAVPSTA